MANTNIGTQGFGGLQLGSPGTSTVITTAPDGRYVVSFTEVNPPARNDGIAWSTLLISESAGLQGPWALIDTQSISPVDPDPSQPFERNFTTSSAVLAEGFYSLVFVDGQGSQSHPLVQVQDNPSAIKPSLSELGSFMRARTVAAGSGGKELGTFTDATRPTASEANVMLEQATNQVLMMVGADIPDRAVQQAKFLVMVYAAQLVELTFYRNEVNRDQSSYEQYVALFQQGIMALSSFVADEGPAAPEASFFSVPVMSESQARFQAYANATNPQTGFLDSSQLPIPEWYPRGPGGIPAQLAQQWPWFGNADTPFGDGDWEIADLEASD